MLANLVPGPLVRWFARPYVAGDTLEAALDVAAAGLDAHGTLTTLDLLGEDVHDMARVEANVAAYRRIFEALGRDPRFAEAASRPSVSLKPSAFTTGPATHATGPLRRLAELARDQGVALTIDMEDHRWTDFTLEVAVGLFRDGFDVGTVLQSRLNRTEGDLARIPAGMRVRLVIGIYPEDAGIAATDKRTMKERLVDYAGSLLDAGAFVEFATHDTAYVERFAREVAVRAPDRCEVQHLLGVPRARLQQRLRSGDLGVHLPVRLYVPFALGWADATAYLRRRMAESPGTVWLVLRNLFARNGAR